MQWAHATLFVKAISEDQRIIEGIASTPRADHDGDIIDPRGAIFQLPHPLLFQHDQRAPIGHVLAADVTHDGIRIRARIGKGVTEQIEEVWKLIKAGLVRGLSVAMVRPRPSVSATRSASTSKSRCLSVG